MQSSQSVLQSDFLKGLPCFLSLAVHVLKSTVYLIFILNTRQKSFHSVEEIVRPTCYLKAAVTEVCICCTFSGFLLWIAWKVMLSCTLFCMPVCLCFYYFGFSGIFNGNYF